MKVSLFLLASLAAPTSGATLRPTTLRPTRDPTTFRPTGNPTTSRPTRNPTTSRPTRAPTDVPTAAPTAGPTASPTASPTAIVKDAQGFAKCTSDGSSKYPNIGRETSERLLLREGVISAIPRSLCDRNTTHKNVILVIGDGMGWEMARAGAIAKRVLKELTDMGINTTTGSPGTPEATAALAAFSGRVLSDYYTEGKGSGLSFQDLANFTLVTTGAPVLQAPSAGNHYAPANSLLKGSVSGHDDGMAPLATNPCGFPIDFSPLDYSLEGGNMALWNDEMGGEFPWDERYFTGVSTGKFDPTFIMQHATDSANTAGSLATGHKAAVNMVSVDLYEEDVSTIVEDAMTCGKAGGVVTSVPILHATPAAFVSHSNNRNSGFQLGKSFETVNPTYASGTCAASGTVPSTAHRNSMLPGGSLSSQWTFLYQGINGSVASNFYDPIQGLDPDDGKHVLACFGGQYTAVAKSEGNMPFRGLDSSYTNRWCSRGSVVRNANNVAIGVVPTTQKCDHYNAAERAQIPTMAKQVEEGLKFLAKDNQGFFMMYEQGDIDWAAHGNHMDDMLGAMLDIDDSVTVIMNWINANGGFAKNALYVTADHDHYLTLNDNFPEVVAKKIINGETYDLTPQSNTNVNPMDVAVSAGKHLLNLTQIDIINDYTTWNETDIINVGHFWGARGAGGNGWGSHSTRPVPLYYSGDGGCIEKLIGKGYEVLGRDVAGIPGKIDQVHIHACMMKNLFGLV